MEDLMTRLKTTYFKDRPDELTDPRAHGIIEAFVEFSKNLLMSNPPVAMITVELGLGFRLSDRSDIAILPQPSYPDRDPRNDSISITDTGYTRKDTQPSRSSSIFG